MLRRRYLKRALFFSLATACLLLTCYARRTSVSSVSFDVIAEVERILEDEASHFAFPDPPTRRYDTDPGALGTLADESLPRRNNDVYRQELEDFVAISFPKAFQNAALTSIGQHLRPSTEDSFEPIPRKYVFSPFSLL